MIDVPCKYDVVLADFPWYYYGDPKKMAAAGKHYDLMTKEEIFDFPMYDLLKDEGVLFLWATCPRLDWAMEAISQWGLHFRGVPFIWVKTKADGTPIGAQGVRPSFVKPLTEMVLVAAKKEKGRVIPLASESVSQTIFAPRREHSRKPQEVIERIDSLFKGDLEKIELFSREDHPDWDSWGNEVGKYV